MTLALPRLQDDVATFVRSIVDDPRFRWLTSQFRPGSDALAGLRQNLEVVSASFGAEDREQSIRIARHWADTSKPIPAPKSPGSLSREVVSAVKNWDFRLGRERDSIPADADLLPPGVASVVHELAADWGMKGTPPPSGHFDAVIILGGMVRANVVRPIAARRLLAEDVTAGSVIGLAGVRVPGAEEAALAARLGVPADSEEAALRFGLERAFGLQPDQWAPRRSTSGNLSVAGSEPPVWIGAAPVGPRGRATTDDALSWLVNLKVVPEHGALLAVTTPIYVIANHISMLVQLAPRFTVCTCGPRLPSDLLSADFGQPVFSQHYLQEMKSIVDALPGLETWAGSAEVEARGT